MQTQQYERINILIPKEIANKLRQVAPRGRRSKLVSEAIEEKLERLSRKEMYAELLRIRKDMPKVSIDEVVKWVREDRQSH